MVNRNGILGRFVLAILLILIAVLPACSGGGDTGGPSTGVQRIEGFFPYVENVILPDEVYSGEKFRYTVVVSVNGQDDLLSGKDELDLNIGGGIVFDGSAQRFCLIGNLFIRNAGEGAVRTEYSRTGEFPEEGSHCIAILSAPTPEQGGMPGKYETVGTPGPITPGLIYREFPVTVLPARELE